MHHSALKMADIDGSVAGGAQETGSKSDQNSEEVIPLPSMASITSTVWHVFSLFYNGSVPQTSC